MTSSYKMAAKQTELHAPIGRDGEGLYTASTKGCFDVIDAATPAVLAQVQKAALTTGPFVIADFGTADAGTSLGLMCQVIDKVRGTTNIQNDGIGNGVLVKKDHHEIALLILKILCIFVMSDKVRERESGKEVSIMYEDQLQNEWKSVFNHAFGNISVADAYGKTDRAGN